MPVAPGWNYRSLERPSAQHVHSLGVQGHHRHAGKYYSFGPQNDEQLIRHFKSVLPEEGLFEDLASVNSEFNRRLAG